MKVVELSSFTRNILTLVSGTVLAQALPIMVSPILTRIYSPEEFGILALYMAVISVFSSIATARYELAVILPKKESDSLAIVILCLLVSIFIGLVLFVLILIWGADFSKAVGNPELSNWLYWAPLTVVLVAVYNTLRYYNNRFDNFKNVASSAVWKSLVMTLVNLVYGLVKKGAAGLIIGFSLSFLAGSVNLSRTLKKVSKDLKAVTRGRVKAMAMRYSEFPKFSAPSILTNVIAMNANNVFTSFMFNVKTLGFYSFCNQILGAPVSVISQSVSQAFLNEAKKSKESYGDAQAIFKATVKKLFLISTPIFLLVFFFSELLFAFFFGEEWSVAGTYARILTPLFWARFIVVPVSIATSVFEQERQIFIWQIGFLIISLALFGITFSLKLEVLTFLKLYSLVLTIHYFILLWVLNKVVRPKF